jgi:hypothetical protein
MSTFSGKRKRMYLKAHSEKEQKWLTALDSSPQSFELKWSIQIPWSHRLHHSKPDSVVCFKKQASM